MTKEQALLDAVVDQRNAAMNACAALAAELAIAQERIKELETKVETQS